MKRGFSPAATAAFVTTVVVLGLVGWSIGWLAAGTDLASQNRTDSTQSPTPPVQATKSPTPSATPSKAATASPSPTRTDAFAMPDFTGRKFIEARVDARKLKLGVTVEFGETGKPVGTVVRTSPKEKVFVWPGLQIILYVAGPAPKVIVPITAGKACGDGKDTLLDIGLGIESYPTGVRGQVVKTEPQAGAELTWNDKVKVYCAV